ncbi:DUF3489 domain-containing protein [Sphingosinicella rhizophila]|uniref:DUF3489 domain-containing protein n=1 Tax=Sphingosinicella rhizophila TaxID=3050082 RepID=A0ABU3Q3D2_9SPHN|nr:DUF3489 domain-containing protein [Sphingosinicella sp. GR2756]MDT9597923.1 DUF3489 domain-containing protein [Sphingosinicella sp. GR2756]
MTIKLNDLQLILLSTASQRADGNFLPLPESLAEKTAAAQKALATLLKRNLASEVPAKGADQLFRQDGEDRIGLVITAAGLQAIGAEERVTDQASASEPETKPEWPLPNKPRSGTKSARLIELLSRAEGAKLDDIIEATGWLPHTTRAALTGLRKKGHTIIRETQGGISIYHIDGGAQ